MSGPTTRRPKSRSRFRVEWPTGGAGVSVDLTAALKVGAQVSTTELYTLASDPGTFALIGEPGFGNVEADYDPGGIWSGAEFVVPQSGIYKVWGEASFDESGAGANIGRRGLFVTASSILNNAAHATLVVSAATGNFTTLNGSGGGPLYADDTIELRVGQTSGFDIDIDTAYMGIQFLTAFTV